jgi:glutamate-1-semialdehyde 2,1-aminomutase
MSTGAETTTTIIDRERISELAARQRSEIARRTPRSREHFERAVNAMPGGVPSSFQVAKPYPIYLERGEGAHVWDVDGNEFTDFHGGFGVGILGHAHPAIVAAVSERVRQGTHFAAPTSGSIEVAEELARRFSLPQWRFTNSGTESTMDAVHLARGATGRDVILKVEGSYHGHHDSVMVDVRPPLDQLGPRGELRSIPYGGGLTAALTELTKAVPFNDLEALESALTRLEGRVAGLIMEPAMMNITIVPPQPGYLEGVQALCREHGVKLIFDEVKTGACIAAGGAVERFGVVPDMVTLAKAIAGGLPGGAIGMSEEIAALVAEGTVSQYGTFNGNPLVMAAARATLTEVLTPEAYARLDEMNARLMRALDEIIAAHDLPAHTVGLLSKGCVVWSAEPLREYRDYATKVDPDLSVLSWLYHVNHGVFMTPGVDEQWTLSVQHTDEDLQRYIDAFELFAHDVTG